MATMFLLRSLAFLLCSTLGATMDDDVEELLLDEAPLCLLQESKLLQKMIQSEEVNVSASRGSSGMAENNLDAFAIDNLTVNESVAFSSHQSPFIYDIGTMVHKHLKSRTGGGPPLSQQRTTLMVMFGVCLVVGLIFGLPFVLRASNTSTGVAMMAESDLAAASAASQNRLWENVLTAFLGGLVISLSVGLIHFNNWLMQEEHFPYAIALVFTHMIFGACLSALLLLATPSLFPALTDPEQRVSVDAAYFAQKCLPISVLFAGGLVLGNVAYSHLSVAFIQMIKESNLVWVYLLSLACGFERLSCGQAQIIAIAIMGMGMAIHGELNFSLFGFVAQTLALLCESCRIILQGTVLSGGGKKLDPLSYMVLICPPSALCLACMLLLSKVLPSDGLDGAYDTPSLQTLRDFAPILLSNACVAFSLNLSIAAFLKRTSPMAYCMNGLLKDVAAVLVGVVVVKEVVAPLQVVGFVFELLAVALWSLLKNFPARFSAGLLTAATLSAPAPDAAHADSTANDTKLANGHLSGLDEPLAVAKGKEHHKLSAKMNCTPCIC
eukprot:TRINITY_DN15975_c0_g3_i1.p1 TRINITY_DN15975_c0_g3~~TRINITY_DN15975_c0_g3_i1.p1  ORF type:complete len:552 (+),score=135.32 TRINITY_DN15975_c0_g3_i1:67-1722(+)